MPNTPHLLPFIVLSRSLMFSDSPLCLGIINFSIEGNVKKGIIIILFVFIWNRSDH